MTDLSPELIHTLYTASPADFLSVRQQLAADAKTSGAAELARQITAQRKPTAAAWIVNQQVHAEPQAVERLLDLGSRLRTAHEQLDASALRELSTERRQVVTDLAADALARAGRTDAGAALRDDVTDTFDAAVADPQIAARLGRLHRPERWSGFGVAMDAPAGTPELTVIRGGRGQPTTRRTTTQRTTSAGQTAGRAPSKDTETPARPDAAARRRAQRTRDKAAAAFDRVENDLHDTEAAEHAAVDRVHALTAKLSEVQAELEATKRDQDRLRRELKSARSRRREARSALDRAQRQLDTAAHRED